MKLNLDDELLRGINFRELLLTIHTNEEKRDVEVIKKVYRELARARLEEANYTLEQNFQAILEHFKRGETIEEGPL